MVVIVVKRRRKGREKGLVKGHTRSQARWPRNYRGSQGSRPGIASVSLIQSETDSCQEEEVFLSLHSS
jgi:hypothetical protein